MTNEEAINQLCDLTDEDPESSHIDAEAIMLQFLRDNGYADVAEAFETTASRDGFWYS